MNGGMKVGEFLGGFSLKVKIRVCFDGGFIESKLRRKNNTAHFAQNHNFLSI